MAKSRELQSLDYLAASVPQASSRSSSSSSASSTMSKTWRPGPPVQEEALQIFREEEGEPAAPGPCGDVCARAADASRSPEPLSGPEHAQAQAHGASLSTALSQSTASSALGRSSSAKEYEPLSLPSPASRPVWFFGSGRTRRFVRSLARRPFPGAGRGAAGDDADGPRIKDLVPITKAGKELQEWVDLRHSFTANACKAIGKPKLTGAIMLQVPPESFLGLGTYGVVWRARHRRTGVEYAVKNVAPSTATCKRDLASRERAVCERVLAAPHPCIVQLHAVREFKDNGLIAFVMELCECGDLMHRIDEAQTIAKRAEKLYEPPECAHLWTGHVFLGLEHLHRQDLLSRDVKPENVVFSSAGVAKLTDFGFGRLSAEADACDWTFGVPSGTPGYCAPEILRQEPHDTGADLYSYGVLVWMLLTGGKTNSDVAWPPMGERRHAADFEAFYNDWSLLTRCLVAPERNHARRLPSAARAFVEGLVRRNPRERLSHEQVRSHAFMSTLQLPAPDAPLSDVEEWLILPNLGSIWSLD